MENNVNFSYTPLFWDQTFKCYQVANTELLKVTHSIQTVFCDAQDTYVEPHTNPCGREQQCIDLSLLLKKDFGFQQDDCKMTRHFCMGIFSIVGSDSLLQKLNHWKQY